MLLGIFFCCFCWPIPFYFNCYKDVEHYCSQCDTYIGKYINREYERWGKNGRVVVHHHYHQPKQPVNQTV
uniref:LITAF domain-containing protein n=1 Tax=Meloidogyne hapla TaxID=6305 RepID=A0A1I8BKN9_MELHA